MKFEVKRFEELTPSEVYEILKARSLVFMLEQGISCLDMDDMDYASLHVFAREEEKVTAYMRVFALPEQGDVKIGRVLTLSRKKGNGRAMMKACIEAAKEKLCAARVLVDAQVSALPFYEKCGFRPVSDEFEEEGVSHVKMILDLN